MNKTYAWALLLLLAAAPRLWGQSQLVLDLMPGPTSSFARSLYVFDNQLLLSGRTPAGYRHLVLDTTTGQTASLWPGQNSIIRPVISVDYIEREGSILYARLVRYDSTAREVDSRFAKEFTIR